MIIRKYKEADKDELIKIFMLNVPKYFDPLEVKDFERYLNEKSDTYWTVEENEVVVGGVGGEIRKEDSSGHITWIFFHPEFSGKGIGSNSVSHVLNILQSDPLVNKLVVRTSQLAFQFFEKFGYKIIETKKDYWGDGLDLYHMEALVENVKNSKV